MLRKRGEEREEWLKKRKLSGSLGGGVRMRNELSA